MQKDMHYGGIKVLAIKAGFSPEEAELIAYASQQTDDATMYRGVKIKGLPKFVQPLIRGRMKLFEPVCTAHKGLDLINGFFPATQEKVFIPFHFLPGEFYSGQGEYDYRTVAGSNFARSLWNRAHLLLLQAKNDFERRFALISLGIALHTFFDTWSHAGFSGRWSEEDNDVSNVEKKTGATWVEVEDYGPDIGHTELLNLVDLPFVEWRARNHQGQEIGRKNSEDFLQAAEKIYSLLRFVKKTPNSFIEVEDKLRALFSFVIEGEEARLQRWKHLFPEIDFAYDKNEWLKAAIGDPLRYDPIESRRYPGINRYKYQGDDRWVLFQLAAAEQRQWVLERIKPV